MKKISLILVFLIFAIFIIAENTDEVKPFPWENLGFDPNKEPDWIKNLMLDDISLMSKNSKIIMAKKIATAEYDTLTIKYGDSINNACMIYSGVYKDKNGIIRHKIWPNPKDVKSKVGTIQFLIKKSFDSQKRNVQVYDPTINLTFVFDGKPGISNDKLREFALDNDLSVFIKDNNYFYSKCTVKKGCILMYALVVKHILKYSDDPIIASFCGAGPGQGVEYTSYFFKDGLMHNAQCNNFCLAYKIINLPEPQIDVSVPIIAKEAVSIPVEPKITHNVETIYLFIETNTKKKTNQTFNFFFGSNSTLKVLNAN
jgi:hypothetical protein